MSEILLINPKKRRTKRRTTKRKTTTSRKRTTRRANPKRRVVRRASSTRRKPTTRRRVTKRRSPARRRTTATKGAITMPKRRRRTKARRNPTRRRRITRRAVSRARGSILGLNIMSALKSVPLTQLGMLGAKWMAKRFNGGTHTDPETWQWDDYLKGALGAAASGVIANFVKRGTGQKVLEGGLNLILYYLIQNELISQSDWATAQFGQIEPIGPLGQDEYYPEEYMGGAYEPGDVEYNSAGQPYMLGQDGQTWQELPEEVGDVIEPVGPLGFGTVDDKYRAMLLGDA